MARKQISQQFIQDYAVSYFETYGSFEGFSTNCRSAYSVLQNRRKKTVAKTQKDNSNDGFEGDTMVYLYHLVGVQKGSVVNIEVRAQMIAHIRTYGSFSNLETNNTKLYKVLQEIANEKETSTVSIIKAEGLGQYLTTNVRFSQLLNVNRTLDVLATYLFVKIDTAMGNRIYAHYEKTGNTFESLVDKDKKLADDLLAIMQSYGGDVPKDYKSDVVVVGDLWYGCPLVDSSSVQTLIELLYIYIGTKTRDILPPSVMHELKRHNFHMGNLRYLYSLYPQLFSKLIQYWYMSGKSSIKEMLNTEGFHYTPMDWDNDFCESKQGLIEARLNTSEDRNTEKILMDKKVYGYLYQANYLDKLRIRYKKVVYMSGQKAEVPMVTVELGDNKEIEFYTLYLQVTSPNFRDGNTLNISSNNMVKASVG